MEVRQRMELTDTNRPLGLTLVPISMGNGLNPRFRATNADCSQTQHVSLLVKALLVTLAWRHFVDTGPRSGFSGGYGGRVTPDPIPNSVVKPSSADGTAGETLWESRTPPDLWPPR